MIDESLAERIFLFLPHTTTVPAFQEIPDIASILVYFIQHSEWNFHENFWC